MLMKLTTGNWKDLNEFFEYCTEWEPTNSLYFGGKYGINFINNLQAAFFDNILSPKNCKAYSL